MPVYLYFKFYGNNGVTDQYVFSPLLLPISNLTQSALNAKANLNGSNATGTWTGITAGNSNGVGGYQYSDGVASIIGSFMVSDGTDNKWKYSLPSQVITTLGIDLKANDSAVLHKTGNETKTGNLNLFGLFSVSNSAGGLVDFYNADGTTRRASIGQGNYVVPGGNPTGYGFNAVNLFQLSVDTTIAVTVLNNGNVGFNTATPTEKLEVAGNIKATGKMISLNAPVDAVDVIRKQEADLKADLVAGKVPASQLPSDVLEYANLASFPAIGESGKLYLAIDTNKPYRWTGSSYVVTGSDVALGETSSTAYRGDRGKTAYDHSQTTGNPHNTQIVDIPDLEDKLQELSVAIDDIIESVIIATKTIDFPTLSGHSATWVEVEIIGAAVGDFVQVVPPVSLLLDDSFFNHVAYDAFVSDADKVRLRMQHTSTLPSSIDIPSGDYKFRIQK